MSPLASPTLRAHTALQERVSEIKTRLESVRSEAVTGRASDIGRAVNGDVGKVQRLQASLTYAEDRASTLAFAGSRAAAAQQALNTVRDQATNVRNTALTGLSGGNPQAVTTAQDQSLTAITDTISRLNNRYGAQSLFGGDEAGATLGSAQDMIDELTTIYTGAPDVTTALADIDTWFNDPAGGFAATFFQGGDGDGQSVELAEGSRVTTSVKADSAEIRQVLQGLAVTALSAKAPTVEARDATLTAGQDLLSTSIEGMADLQARLGVTEERIGMARTEYDAEVTSLGIAMNGLTGRDQAAAASEMRLLESQLEAAYLTTSRMANLSLINFIR